MTKPTPDPLRVSLIRRNGWPEAALARAVAHLTAHLAFADDDAGRLAAELLRQLAIAAAPPPAVAPPAAPLDPFLLAAAHGLRAMLPPAPTLRDVLNDTDLPPVPPDLEPLAAILDRPEPRTAALRAAFADPVALLIALLDDLATDERAGDPQLQGFGFALHHAALLELGAIASPAAIAFLLSWCDDDLTTFDTGHETSPAFLALQRVGPAALLDAAIAAWPQLGVSSRLAVTDVLAKVETRDPRLRAVLLAWLEAPAADGWSEAPLWALEAYRDPTTAPACRARLAWARTHGDAGLVAAIEETLAVLGPNVSRRARPQRLA
jgi:hypothetical protein